MAKKNSKSKGGKRASLSKLANKRLYKLSKQGKLKKKVKKYKHLIKESTVGDKFEQISRYYHHPNDHSNKDEKVGENGEMEIPLGTEDHDYFGSNDNDISFLENIQGSVEKFNKYKRKRLTDEEVEEKYEKIPRKLLGEKNKDMKALLPIKNKKGLIPQMIEREKIDTPKANPTSVQVKKDDSMNHFKDSEPLPELTTVELFAQRQSKLKEIKRRIAQLASGVLESPEEGTRKLKELRLMLLETDPLIFITVRKLVMVSLAEVFKDIIPGYRIRVASQAEKEQKVKKETKKLRDFEQGLVSNYKHYLEFLEKMACGKKKQSNIEKKKRQLKPEEMNALDLPVPPQAERSLRDIAVGCLCDLMVTHPHFNFGKNIVQVIVPFMNKNNAKISDIVCGAMKKLFKEDRAGNITLETVRTIGKVIKARNFRVEPKILNVFLALRIKEVATGKDDKTEDKKKPMMRKERMKAFSRRERKRQKKMKELEKDMEEAAITDTKNQRIKINTQIIEAVFLTYFRILKNARKSVLLSSVLEGLAKFAHLINVDFFDDLFSVLNELTESGELTLRESLHCVQTAFTILTGQGAALNIDPLRFYRHLYCNLCKLHLGNCSDDVPIVINCLDVMINKRRKQVSQQRVLAYIKRLSTICLQLSSHGALGIMAITRGFIHNYSKTDILYDTESHGSGVYLPELDEPEHCNAHNTALFEYHLLRHHYHPTVSKYACHMCKQAPSQGEGQLPIGLARKSPQLLLEEFNAEDMTFRPSVAKPSTRKHKNKVPYITSLHDGFKGFLNKHEELISN